MQLPDCVDIEQSHLSPQHYELSGKQDVLDRARVLVSEQCTKANKPTSLGEVAVQT